MIPPKLLTSKYITLGVKFQHIDVVGVYKHSFYSMINTYFLRIVLVQFSEVQLRISEKSAKVTLRIIGGFWSSCHGSAVSKPN